MKFQERDWKYMSRIHDELLEALCARINRESVQILQTPEPEHVKYAKLFDHIRKSDKLVAVCFDDWRRSTIEIKAVHLHEHGLLTRDHLAQLSPEAQDVIAAMEEMRKESRQRSRGRLGTIS